MNRNRYWTIALAALLILAIPGHRASAGQFVAGLNLGTQAGPGVQASGTFLDFTRDASLSARFSFAFHRSDAGNPYDARRVFINENTNGTPEDKARYTQFRFDLVIPVWQLGQRRVFLFAGPRKASYTAEFVYVGGNEDFEVKTSPWGAGVGLETRFAVGDRAEFLLQVGLDHFLKADLTGHDTTYTPDGDHVNPRDGYDFASADEAVNQPRTEMLLMAGLQFGF